MDSTKLKKTIKSAAVFTVAPAVAIVISVIALSKSLGVALPWLRLSVVGSLSYETVAAGNASSAMGLTLGQTEALTASQFVTIALVMTISILVGIWLVPLVAKKVQGGMINLGKKDAKWAGILSSSMFIGMISAFLGFVFCDISRLWTSENGIFTTVEDGVTKTYSSTSGLIPVFVMLTSAIIMVICGLLMKSKKMKWLGEYALPISLILGMLSAIPITNLLG
jgi:uncharacterized membrane protein YhdT